MQPWARCFSWLRWRLGEGHQTRNLVPKGLGGFFPFLMVEVGKHCFHVCSSCGLVVDIQIHLAAKIYVFCSPKPNVNPALEAMACHPCEIRSRFVSARWEDYGLKK